MDRDQTPPGVVGESVWLRHPFGENDDELPSMSDIKIPIGEVEFPFLNNPDIPDDEYDAMSDEEVLCFIHEGVKYVSHVIGYQKMPTTYVNTETGETVTLCFRKSFLQNRGPITK